MAQPTLKLSFILSATDKMSRIVDEAVKKSIDRLSAFERTTGKVGRSLMQVGTVMMGAGAAVGGSLFAVSKATADYAGDMFDMARATGLGVEAFQEIAYAAKMSGIEAEKVKTSFVKFDKLIMDAAGGNKTYMQTFKDLGIQIKDSAGNLRKPNEIFEDIADIFHDVPDGAAKTALAYELFGKSGADLIPMLNDGKAGLKEFYKAARESGNFLNNEAIQAADAYSDQLQEMGLKVKGAKIQIGNALIPTISKLIEKISEVATKVIKWITDNSELVKQIGKTVLEVAKFAVVVGGISFVLGGLLPIIGKAASAFKLLKAASAAGSIGKGIVSLLTPMGLIKIAIIAIAALAYIIIKNWDSIVAFFKRIWQNVKDIFTEVINWIKNIWSGVTEFFSNLWGGIQKGFNAAWEWIKKMFLNYAPYGLIIKHWDTISGFFVRLWGKIKEGIRRGWDVIKNIFLNYTPYGLIIKHWDVIIAWFSNLWVNIKAGISSAWSGIKDWFSNLQPVEWIMGAWDSVGDFFSGLGTRFFEWGKNLLTSLWNGITSMVNKVVDGVKNIGKKIAGGFKSFFGINSPSKLFAEYGVNLTQGLVVGMDRGGNAIESATGGMAVHATSGINHSIQSNTVSTSTVMNGGNAGVSLIYSPQITFNGPVSQETKAEFSKMLRQHANDIIAIIQRDNDNRTRLSFNV